jgi:putative transcriptional regulator
MSKNNPKGAELAQEMLAGLQSFIDTVESGQSLVERFTVRSVRLNLQRKEYGPEDVKRVRSVLNASQGLLAKFLGVSTKTVSAWEQGTHPVPGIACRYLDDILANPELFTSRIVSVNESATASSGG